MFIGSDSSYHGVRNSVHPREHVVNAGKEAHNANHIVPDPTETFLMAEDEEIQNLFAQADF